MIMLMKFFTGEDWNAFMFELANTKGYGGQDCVVSINQLITHFYINIKLGYPKI